MAKHSKRTGRRMRQAGLGGGCRAWFVACRRGSSATSPTPRSSAPKPTIGCAVWSTRTGPASGRPRRSSWFPSPRSTAGANASGPTISPRSNRARAGPIGPGARPGRRPRSRPRPGPAPAAPAPGQAAPAGAFAPPGHRLECLDDRADAGQPASPPVAARAACGAGPSEASGQQRPYATRVPKDKRAPHGARRPDPARHDASAPAARGGTAPIHRDRCRQPLRRGRGPGDRLRPRERRRTSSPSSLPGCRSPFRRSRSTGDPNSWPGSKRPAGTAASPSTCCRRAVPSSTAGSSGSTARPGGSAGSATRATSPCPPSKPPCGTGRSPL